MQYNTKQMLFDASLCLAEVFANSTMLDSTMNIYVNSRQEKFKLLPAFEYSQQSLRSIDFIETSLDRIQTVVVSTDINRLFNSTTIRHFYCVYSFFCTNDAFICTPQKLHNSQFHSEIVLDGKIDYDFSSRLSLLSDFIHIIITLSIIDLLKVYYFYYLLRKSK